MRKFLSALLIALLIAFFIGLQFIAAKALSMTGVEHTSMHNQVMEGISFFVALFDAFGAMLVFVVWVKHCGDSYIKGEENVFVRFGAWLDNYGIGGGGVKQFFAISLVLMMTVAFCWSALYGLSALL